MRIWMRFLRNMQFVCKQVPSIIDYMQASGLVVGKTGPHNVKKMPISLQNSASPQSLSKGRGGVVCIVTSLRAVGLYS